MLSELCLDGANRTGCSSVAPPVGENNGTKKREVVIVVDRGGGGGGLRKELPSYQWLGTTTEARHEGGEFATKLLQFEMQTCV